MKIVTDANIPYIEGVLEPFAEVVYIPGRRVAAADVKDADALLVRTRTNCGAELLGGSKVRFIGTATIGTDHIDMEYCSSHGIEVASAAGSNSRGVLQWVAAVLNLLSLGEGWEPAEKTLGIVGVGNVGSLVKEFASAWGFRVLCSDPPREEAEGLGRKEGFVPLQEIAARCGIVTFHTPLTSSGNHPTLNLAGKEFFEAAGTGTVIINSARGGIVNESELKKAVSLKNCIACLDTWAGEPDIDRELLSMAAVATPHIAGYTVQGKANASAMIVNALAKCFGLPLREWYPAGIEKTPGNRTPISWAEMDTRIGSYRPAQETAELQKTPDRFEPMRERYLYRQEFF